MQSCYASILFAEKTVVRSDKVACHLLLGDVAAILVDVRSAKNHRDREDHRVSLLSDLTVKEGMCVPCWLTE